MPPRPRMPWIVALAALVLLSPDAPTRAGDAPAARRPAVVPPRREVLDLALRAYSCGQAEGAVQRPVLAVIDYSLPSTRRRLWLVDPGTGRTLRSELVAHGRGSGGLRATRFSNLPGSYRSSLGLFVTGEAYRGGHGEALRLYGLEPGVNDAAYERDIVMHAAWYVSEAHVARFGRLGRSQGCPALAPDVAPEVLDALADGAAVFVYGDDPAWLAGEHYATCDGVAPPAHPAAGSAANSSASLTSRR